MLNWLFLNTRKSNTSIYGQERKQGDVILKI
jgi:hypothetical protein